MKPKVSVVMSAHNAELDMLRQSVQCILDQTFRDFEFVIVDDVNGEQSAEYLDSLTKLDSRVRLLRNPKNLGLTASLIRGIDASRGEYLARQDADDISRPERLELGVARLDSDRETVLLGSWYSVTVPESGEVLHYHPPDDPALLFRQLYFTNPFCHAAVLFRQSAYEQVGGYNQQFRTTQDLDLWFRLARVGRLGMVEKQLVIRQLHSGSLSLSRRAWQQVSNSARIRWRERAAYTGRAVAPIVIAASAYHAIMTLLPTPVGSVLARLVRCLRQLIRFGRAQTAR